MQVGIVRCGQGNDPDPQHAQLARLRAVQAQQLDQLLAIMLLIALIGIGVDALIFKRLERAVRVRWGLAS